MKKMSRNRRGFLSLCAKALVVPLVSRNVFAFKNLRSTSWKLQVKDKQLGLKVTQVSTGLIVISFRDLKGKKLALIPLGMPGGRSARGSVSWNFKPENRTGFSIEISGDGVISSDLRSIIFGEPDHSPGSTSQGFFGWVKDVVHDVGVSIAAGAAYLTGGFGEFSLKTGGHISVGDGGIGYSGGGGFKLDPGMEEDPNIWY